MHLTSRFFNQKGHLNIYPILTLERLRNPAEEFVSEPFHLRSHVQLTGLSSLQSTFGIIVVSYLFPHGGWDKMWEDSINQYQEVKYSMAMTHSHWHWSMWMTTSLLAVLMEWEGGKRNPASVPVRLLRQCCWGQIWMSLVVILKQAALLWSNSFVYFCCIGESLNCQSCIFGESEPNLSLQQWESESQNYISHLCGLNGRGTMNLNRCNIYDWFSDNCPPEDTGTSHCSVPFTWGVSVWILVRETTN